MENFYPKLLATCSSCCIGENNDISVCKDGPIFNSEQLKEFPQFGKHIK